MTRPKLDYDKVEDILARLRYYHSASCKADEVAEKAQELLEDSIRFSREYDRAEKVWRMMYANAKERKSG